MQTTQMATPVLEVAHLEKVYGALGNVTRALNDVNFTVNRGEFVGIMGASGSGKSTLLNCVSTIDAATSGAIRINGQDVTRMKQAKLSQFRREELGFIFQDSNLLDTLTARENIALPLTIARANSAEISTRVQDVAARLSISQVLDKYPYQMSGGQQQRVAAARALVTDPTMIMADEPTGALDSKSARLLLESLEALNRRLRATVLMVTHDSFAASYTSRVLFIRDGKIFTELRRPGLDPRGSFRTARFSESVSHFEDVCPGMVLEGTVSNVAAFGAFTAVSYETPQTEKQALGHLAYVLEAMGRLNSIDHYCAHVEYDGGTVDGDFIFGGVSNSTSVAGMVRLRKDLVSLGDGLFETLLIRRPKQFGDLSRIISGVLNQNYDNENVILVQSKTLRFTFDEPVAWTRDGEAGGVTTDVTLRNNHAAIHIIA